MADVIDSDRIYIPINQIKVGKAKREFTKIFFRDEQQCRKCEYRHERPCDTCQQCDNYGGTFKLFKEVDIDDVEYIGLPSGARKKIIEMWPHLRDLVKDDQRPTPKLSFRKDWEFLWEPFYYQTPAVEAMVKAGYGVLEAPPRSGKTAMGIMLMMALGLRVIIMASQRDWLEQFMETFYEATNIADIEKARGKRYVGIADKIDDFKNLEICLCTYQSFLSDGNGRKKFDIVRSRFGVLVIDEVHKSAADEFAKVVNALNVRHRFGLTGTPDRKDGKY
jgi:superfamily II DNA or RNA helicase